MQGIVDILQITASSAAFGASYRKRQPAAGGASGARARRNGGGGGLLPVWSICHALHCNDTHCRPFNNTGLPLSCENNSPQPEKTDPFVGHLI